MEVILNILLLAVINCFLIGLLLIVNQKGNLTANKYYGLLALSLSLVALENILILSGDILKVPHLLSVGAIMMTLVPPFSYLLYQHLIDLKKRTSGKVLFLHTLPFILCGLTLMPLYLQSGEAKAEIIQNVYYEHQSIRGFVLLYSALNILQFIIYNTLIAGNLKKSNYTKPKRSLRFAISWMNILWLTMNVIVGVYIMLYLSFIYSTEFQSVLIMIFVTLIVSTIYLTGYQLVKNPFYFDTHQAIYERSTFKSEMAEDLDNRLNSIMFHQKPYLRPGIKLSDIASQLNVTPHQLSQFLNQSKETSFIELMNSLRVKHASEILKVDASSSKTILAIALESGFSNQANFIKVFKEITGLTPNKFRKGCIGE